MGSAHQGGVHVLVSEGLRYPEKNTKDGFWQDEYADPDDLYWEMSHERREENYGYGGRSILEQNIDEYIEDAPKRFANPETGFLEKLGILYSFPSLCEAKAEAVATRVVVDFAGTKIQWLSDVKTKQIAQANQLIQWSENGIRNTNQSIWLGAGSFLMIESALNFRETAYQIPDTYLDSALMASGVVSCLKTVQPVVKLFQLSKPTQLFIGGTRPTRFVGIGQEFRANHVLIPANQNVAISFSHMERSPAVRKVLHDFNERTGFFTPLEQPRLKLIEGRQTHNLSLVNSNLLDKLNVLGRPFEAKDFVTTRSKLFGTDQVYTFKADRVRQINGQKPDNYMLAGTTYHFDQVKDPLLRSHLNRTYPHGVPFTGTGFPDFSRYAIKKVEIQMTGKN